MAQAAPTPTDVVDLAVTSQDTDAAVAELAAVTPVRHAGGLRAEGAANEHAVARHGFAPYGMYVAVASTYLGPGSVALHTAPANSIVDIGRFPAGLDATAFEVWPTWAQPASTRVPTTGSCAGSTPSW